MKKKNSLFTNQRHKVNKHGKCLDVRKPKRFTAERSLQAKKILGPQVKYEKTCLCREIFEFLKKKIIIGSLKPYMFWEIEKFSSKPLCAYCMRKKIL